MDARPFARFAPAQTRRPWHRFQHIYLWLFYAVITMRWQFISDFAFLRAGVAGRTKLRRPTGSALAFLPAPHIQARRAPAETAGTALVRPPGSEIKILSTRGQWSYAQLPNDLRGWIPANSAQRVRL